MGFLKNFLKRKKLKLETAPKKAMARPTAVRPSVARPTVARPTAAIPAKGLVGTAAAVAKGDLSTAIPAESLGKKEARPQKFELVKKQEEDKKDSRVAKESGRETESKPFYGDKRKTKSRAPIAYRVLRKPHITEKSSDLTKQNQYVFEIWPRANKDAVKKGIEELYNVDVEQVRIIKAPAKRRRLGKITGWRKAYKKAIVKIKEGQRIEVLPR